MSDTPITDDYARLNPSAKRWEWIAKCAEVETDLNERIKQLEREVELLRLYGNKDCIAQADEVLKKEAKL